MPGRDFGKYHLVERIATGGMAEIYLAKTKGIAGFEKFVALKMIHENFSNDSVFADMLVEEAKLTVQLQHVNIAQTFDLGKVGDKFYFTMEFIDGADLYRAMRYSARADRPVPAEIAAYIAKEVCNGLHYAHDKIDRSGEPLDVIHRDVSPQNVLISRSGEVKLVDFGIARASKRAQKTQVGVIKGKYYYMSPEQARGDTLDRRTDVFAAGILLYEMLVGRMLYFHKDILKLLEQVRAAKIEPPSTIRIDIPAELEAITMKALQRRVDDRFSTADEMAKELSAYLNKQAQRVSYQDVSAWIQEILALGEAVDKEVAPPVTTNFTSDARARPGDQIPDENSVLFDLSQLEKPPRKISSQLSSHDGDSGGERLAGDSTQIITEQGQQIHKGANKQAAKNRVVEPTFDISEDDELSETLSDERAIYLGEDETVSIGKPRAKAQATTPHAATSDYRSGGLGRDRSRQVLESPEQHQDRIASTDANQPAFIDEDIFDLTGEIPMAQQARGLGAFPLIPSGKLAGGFKSDDEHEVPTIPPFRDSELDSTTETQTAPSPTTEESAGISPPSLTGSAMDSSRPWKPVAIALALAVAAALAIVFFVMK